MADGNDKSAAVHPAGRTIFKKRLVPSAQRLAPLLVVEQASRL